MIQQKLTHSKGAEQPGKGYEMGRFGKAIPIRVTLPLDGEVQ